MHTGDSVGTQHIKEKYSTVEYGKYGMQQDERDKGSVQCDLLGYSIGSGGGSI